MIFILFILNLAHATESTATRAERMSCEMVKAAPNVAQMHWNDKQELRRRYFKDIYDEFEQNKLTSAESLYPTLAPCDF